MHVNVVSNPMDNLSVLWNNIICIINKIYTCIKLEIKSLQVQKYQHVYASVLISSILYRCSGGLPTPWSTEACVRSLQAQYDNRPSTEGVQELWAGFHGAENAEQPGEQSGTQQVSFVLHVTDNCLSVRLSNNISY